MNLLAVKHIPSFSLWLSINKPPHKSADAMQTTQAIPAASVSTIVVNADVSFVVSELILHELC